MTLLRNVLIATLFCSLPFAGHAQPSTWKSLQCGKVSLRYPPSWHMTKEIKATGTRITMTPDSTMQQLTMRMIDHL